MTDELLGDFADTIESAVAARLQAFKDSMIQMYSSHGREIKHLIAASLIHLLKAEKAVTYKDLADSYGVLSPDTLKSLAARRTYLSDKNLDALYEWLIEEVALFHASRNIEALAKALYPRQFTIRFEEEEE